MPLPLSEIMAQFENEIPLFYQESWDKSGLQVGSRRQKIKRVLFAYDPCHEVIRYAIAKKADLIVTHHPLGLKDYQNIDLDTYEGETIQTAIKNNIAIYTAHTNHDASLYSLNRHYATQFKLEDVKPIVPSGKHPYVKLVVFVPFDPTPKVLKALFDAGAGHIGHYSSCSFRTRGTGTFQGDQTTSPFLGQKGQLHQADENRVEVIVPKHRLNQALARMLAVHPYEEVAYDLIPLDNQPNGIGQGVYGLLEKPEPLQKLIPRIKKIFNVKKIRMSGLQNKRIRTIGLCTGSGAFLLDTAAVCGVDLLITGDVKYHAAISALRRKMVIMDVGHFYSEIKSVRLLKKIFFRLFGNRLHLLEYRGLKDALTER